MNGLALNLESRSPRTAGKDFESQKFREIREIRAFTESRCFPFPLARFHNVGITRDPRVEHEGHGRAGMYRSRRQAIADSMSFPEDVVD